MFSLIFCAFKLSISKSLTSFNFKKIIEFDLKIGFETWPLLIFLTSLKKIDERDLELIQPISPPLSEDGETLNLIAVFF